MPKAETLKTWSFSTADKFENECKLAIYFKKIERLPDPPGPALVRGSRVHKMLEDYMIYELKPFPSNYASTWQLEVDDLIEKGAVAERDIALDRDWNVVGWRDHDAWLRMKIDVSWTEKRVFNVVDYKTGKVWPNSVPQVQLYALVGLLLDKKVKSAHAELWYLDVPHVKELDLDRSDVKELKEKWHDIGERITSETEWPANPSRWNCSYCPAKKSIGGPCSYG